MRRQSALLSLLLAAACTAAPVEEEVRLPAFVDHHVHVFNMGWWILQSERRPAAHVSAAGASSEAEVVSRAVAAAAAAPSGWVTGFGWSQDAWGTLVLPTLDALSNAVPRVPVALARTDGHAL